MANENAKLSSFFGTSKKSSKKKTINANSIIQPSSDNRMTDQTLTGPITGQPGSARGQRSSFDIVTKFGNGSATTGTNLKTEQIVVSDGKSAWSKQPRKAKASKQQKSIPRSAAEYEEQSRRKRHLNLDSQKAFPTLGVDASAVQLMTAKAPQVASIASKNVWSALSQDDDEEEN